MKNELYYNCSKTKNENFFPKKLSRQLKDYYEFNYGKLVVNTEGKVNHIKIKQKVK